MRGGLVMRVPCIAPISSIYLGLGDGTSPEINESKIYDKRIILLSQQLINRQYICFPIKENNVVLIGWNQRQDVRLSLRQISPENYCSRNRG